MKGIIISGKFSELMVRQKHGEEFELGELLITENKNSKMLLQVYDLLYGSQLNSSNLELASGMKLEEENDLEFMDEKLRNYNLAMLKSLITLRNDKSETSKSLPDFFSKVRDVKKEDLLFLTKPKNPLFLGNLRSGTKSLPVPIYLDGEKAFSHHILIPATTGRGKSNLSYVMLWDLLDKNYAGVLVLDPHDEYYGRNKFGLKDHKSGNAVYYSPNPPAGGRTLKINLKQITPNHFNGAYEWTTAQKEALNSYYKNYEENWIEAIILEKEIKNFQEGTVSVLRRRMLSLLDLETDENRILAKGIFDTNMGENTVSDITKELEKGKIVIVDTSSFSGNVEILIGSLIATEILKKYRHYKTTGELAAKPVISIFLEEAPRVLGKEVLEKGPNIFSTIAREGRKFKIGLTAVTQLPSLIPREILANMNTKIILGIEMQPERQAIIDSASQDLSSDSRAIASLDKGEAIITSNFTRFAIPIKIPLFEEYAKKDETKETTKKSFDGINLES